MHAKQKRNQDFESSFNKVRKTYFEHNQDDNVANKTTELSQKILSNNSGKINKRFIVTIPHYIEEDNPFLVINEILKQNLKKITILIYVNGFGADSSNKIKNRVRDINRFIEVNGLRGKVIVFDNLYNKKANIGAIRADMHDALIKSLSGKVRDPIIIGLDSDTYKLQKGYLHSVIK